MIKESAHLWYELSKLAHFEDTAYDLELKNTVAKELSLNPDFIEDGLQKSNISVEKLLVTFLEALKPFSQMMNDLLRTYEIAGARSNANNIEIAFDFDGVPKNCHLDSFRKSVLDLQERLETRTELLDPWKLLNYLSFFNNRFKTDYSENWIGHTKDYPEEIMLWLNEYDRDILPEHLPNFPKTENRELDSSLRQILDLAESSLQRYYKEYNSSLGHRKSLSEAIQKYGTKFWRAETDFWLGKFVEVYFNIVQYLKSLNNTPNGFAEYIDKIFENPNVVRVVTIPELYRTIIEILDMPFWKQRYEMYSAWVFTCIAESISDLGIIYNVEDGVLQFKFSGALLAAICLPDMEIEVWAEKRFPAVNLEGEGRTNNIQPDYSIIKKTNGKEEVCMLIECKQYKRSSIRNFANAVNDYANTKKEAKVLLANYGPISKNLSTRLYLDVKRRYAGYSRMRPETEERCNFVNDVRDYIDSLWVDCQLNKHKDIIIWEGAPKELTIELLWGESPRDLDLEIILRRCADDYSVSYLNLGSIDQYPFMKLDHDVLKGPGKETISISKIISGNYDIFVRNYSGEDIIKDEIIVVVTAGKQHKTITKSSLWQKDTIWHVGMVNSIGLVVTDEHHKNRFS